MLVTLYVLSKNRLALNHAISLLQAYRPLQSTQSKFGNIIINLAQEFITLSFQKQKNEISKYISFLYVFTCK